jgi:WhiB family redox-sensing transcriptional regulator
MQAGHRSPEAQGLSARWSWRMRAACRHMDIAVFFAADGERQPQRDAREARAKGICARCPVIRSCADYAIRYREPHGVWGGLSERERTAAALGLAERLHPAVHQRRPH